MHRLEYGAFRARDVNDILCCVDDYDCPKKLQQQRFSVQPDLSKQILIFGETFSEGCPKKKPQINEAYLYFYFTDNLDRDICANALAL